MRVLEDNYTCPTFQFHATCSHCRSKLVLDSKDDFSAQSITTGGSSHDACRVLRLAFECPLCKRLTILKESEEKMVPPTVVVKVKYERVSP